MPVHLEAAAGKMRVAVVGSGVAGLTAARTLAQAGVEVVLYERDSHIGGHSLTIQVDGVRLDIGFMVFNQVSGATPLDRLHVEALPWMNESRTDLESNA